MWLLKRILKGRMEEPQAAAVDTETAPNWPPGAPIGVRGEGSDGKDFFEAASTLSTSPEGALLLLSAPVRPGQSVILVNYAIEKQKICRVAHADRRGPGTNVAQVVFQEADPSFWALC